MVDNLDAGRFVMGQSSWGKRDFRLLFFHLFQDLLHSRPNHSNNGSLIRFLLQQTHQKFPYSRSYVLIPDPKRCLQYLIENFLIILPRIKGCPMQDLIQDDAQRPHIDGIGIIVKLGLLRRDIFLRACYSLHYDLLRTQPEVG